jgi:hypothetical protein
MQCVGEKQMARDGTPSMAPVEDEANLDVYRARMGLTPIAEYKKQISELYGQPVK